MSFEALLPLEMAVQRPTLTQEPTGAPKRVWATVSGYSAVPCRLEAFSSTERLLAGREGNVELWHLYYGPDYALQPYDRIIVDDTTYEVEGPPKAMYDSAGIHHYEADVIRRT